MTGQRGGLARRTIDALRRAVRGGGAGGGGEAVRAPSATDIELSADIAVTYEPMLDGDPDPGEVVWTWVPYEDDPSQGKDRPVVLFGRRREHAVGVALTSKERPDEAQVCVGRGPWDREGRTSYAKLDRIIDVDPAQVRREGAVLERERFDALVEALRAHHGIVVAPRRR
ncbi:MAG: type II toxin-antitoxin system PemK/MazF family toxin [Ilumatobacteraceae bacterium]